MKNTDKKQNLKQFLTSLAPDDGACKLNYLVIDKSRGAFFCTTRNVDNSEEIHCHLIAFSTNACHELSFSYAIRDEDVFIQGGPSFITETLIYLLADYKLLNSYQSLSDRQQSTLTQDKAKNFIKLYADSFDQTGSLNKAEFPCFLNWHFKQAEVPFTAYGFTEFSITFPLKPVIAVIITMAMAALVVNSYVEYNEEYVLPLFVLSVGLSALILNYCFPVPKSPQDSAEYEREITSQLGIFELQDDDELDDEDKLRLMPASN